jgi:hypothetical protein
MFVEADAVVTQFVEQCPRIQMLFVGAHRDVGLEVRLGQRIRQLFADPEVREIFAVR